MSYKTGELGKCKHGYYFIYKKFSDQAGADRWFAEYEPGADQYGEHGQLTGNIQGFETREEARRNNRSLRFSSCRHDGSTSRQKAFAQLRSRVDVEGTALAGETINGR